MSVSSLLEKLSHLNHGSLTKQSVVSREKKEYRRALQLLSNPTTTYHGTTQELLRPIFDAGELRPGPTGNHGKGVYFSVGIPERSYYPLHGGAIFAANNKLDTGNQALIHVNFNPVYDVTKPIGDLDVDDELYKYYWTRTPDPVSVSNNKTTFILPGKRISPVTGKEVKQDYTNDVKNLRLRTISKDTFKRAYEATHPDLASDMYGGMENPGGSNRVLGTKVFDALLDSDQIQRAINAVKPSAPTQALLDAAGAAAVPTEATQALLGEAAAVAAAPPAPVLDNMKWYRSRNLLGGALAGTAIGGAGLIAHIIHRKKRNAYATNQLAG